MPPLKLATLLDTGRQFQSRLRRHPFRECAASMNSADHVGRNRSGSSTRCPISSSSPTAPKTTRRNGAATGREAIRQRPADVLLHHPQKSRHHDRNPLHSLPAHPESDTFANGEDIYANTNIPNIPPELQTCASTNFFYTAQTDRHQHGPDCDVPPGREHGSSHRLAFRRPRRLPARTGWPPGLRAMAHLELARRKPIRSCQLGRAAA